MEDEQKHFLATPLFAVMKIDWTRALLIALIALSILTRLWDLSYRAWNHDEAIHTDWSWNLYTGRGYQHNPIYHGPFLYHLTAFTYFLFGDNDTTARLPNALFGIILVALPYFFRQWLGKRGWVATAAMLLISPALLYYSRFNRHDIYVELFVVLLALAIWKYFDERKEIWLIAAAALLALAYTSMETTFIFVAIFAVFLCAHFTFEYLRARVKWGNLALGLFAALFGIPFFGVSIAYFIARAWLGRKPADAPDDPESLDPAAPPADYRAIPSFDLAVVLGTFSLPLLTPALFYALNVVWKRAFQTDFFPIAAFSDINALTAIAQSQQDVIWRVLGLTVAMIVLSALIGVWWNSRVWMIGAVLFWPIFIVFFTTIFTNGGGFFTGLLGSLGYWLSQQEVMRGGQPGHYYLLVLLPMYELLPYFVGVAAMAWYWWTYRPGRLFILLAWMLWIIVYYVGIRAPLLALSAPAEMRSPLLDQVTIVFVALLLPLTFFATYDPDDPASAFPTFLFTWVAGVLIIFSWAGEKMPWLTIHLTIPLAFAAGWALDKLLHADWRALIARGAIWLALLIPLALVAFAMLIAGASPFQGYGLAQQSATVGFLVSLAMLAFALALLVAVGRRFAAREIARIVAVSFVAVLVALTVRFAAMAVYINPDVASETMIYAQGSHDNVIAMREIEDLSRRLCAQINPAKAQNIQCEDGKIKVAYDDDSSWPFVWYLRNYRNAFFYGANPNAMFDAPVVIVGPKNEETVKPFLGTKYLKRQYKLIWWPLEGYKDLSAERVLGYFTEPQQRADLFNAWFYHRYKESASQWPYVHNFSFYVRKDVAALLWNYAGQLPAEAALEDEYEKKFVKLTATRALGSEGRGNAQFAFPRNLALDARGNLYVADSDNHRVQKLSATGEFLLAWGARSPDNVAPPPSTFNQPWGIAVDPAGNVYVADTWNHRIQKFDANGKFLTTWGVNGDTRGVANVNPQMFYGPRSIAIDAQGNVLVTDTGNKRVLKFSPNGEPVAQYGGVGSDGGKFLEQVGIALDAQGNIFVADTWNLRIQKFDADFNFLAQWAVPAWESQSVVNKPYLAVDAEGNVFATDPEGSRVLKFSNDGKLLAVFGTRGADLASFNLPTGLAFDAQGNLYVADSGNHRILVFAKP
ncbi:MAG: TIGR03663 family protein [Chloroflexi bacterium]|nr:TIGR03663 family protein [Chloroflexota bacterium]